MVKDDTLSATDFSAVTGVSRERLRTWERRHGFPTPLRHRNGPRRYPKEDIKTVIAIREAIDQGVSVSDAIEAAKRLKDVSPQLTDLLGEDTLASVFPLPLILFSGPEPLKIEYLSTAASVYQKLTVGETIDNCFPAFSESEAHQALLRSLAGERKVIECSHPSFLRARSTARSVVFPLRPQPGEHPLVALVVLESAGAELENSAVDRLTAEKERLDLELTNRSHAIRVVATLARKIRDRESASVVLRSVTNDLVNTLNLVDCGMAIYMGGELALGSSAKGLLGPAMVAVAGQRRFYSLMHEHEPTELDEKTAAIFGASPEFQLIGVPVLAAREPVGVLLLMLEKERAFDPLDRQVIDAIANLISLVLLRDSSPRGEE